MSHSTYSLVPAAGSPAQGPSNSGRIWQPLPRLAPVYLTAHRQRPSTQLCEAIDLEFAQAAQASRRSAGPQSTHASARSPRYETGWFGFKRSPVCMLAIALSTSPRYIQPVPRSIARSGSFGLSRSAVSRCSAAERKSPRHNWHHAIPTWLWGSASSSDIARSANCHAFSRNGAMVWPGEAYMVGDCCRCV